MKWWEKRDQPLSVNSRLKREVNAHHADREAVDHDVNQGEHSGDEQLRLARDLFVHRGDERVLTRLPHVAHGGKASDEVIDDRLPGLDVLGHHHDERSGLLDDRRKQYGEQPEQRGGRADHRDEECHLRRHASVLDEKISHRSQVERENYRDEEKEKDVGCRSKHPEQQERYNHAG